MRQELPIAAEVRPAIDLRAEKIAIDKNLAEERKSGSDSVEAAANAGERFERVANGLKPLGKWIAWLKANGYERRTATNRIIIHKNRAKWESFSHLGVSGVPKSLRVGKEEPEESNEEDDVAEEEIVAQEPPWDVPKHIELSVWNLLTEKQRKLALAVEGDSHPAPASAPAPRRTSECDPAARNAARTNSSNSTGRPRSLASS